MEAQRRGSDGRRLFSAEFKRDQVARVLRKEITFAELSRELGIDQSVVRRWQQLVDRGTRAAVAATRMSCRRGSFARPSCAFGSSNAPSGRGRSRSRSSRRRARKSKKTHVGTACPSDDGCKIALICRVLGIGRASAYREGSRAGRGTPRRTIARRRRRSARSSEPEPRTGSSPSPRRRRVRNRTGWRRPS
jgi:hypothetical protein